MDLEIDRDNGFLNSAIGKDNKIKSTPTIHTLNYQ